MKMKPRQSMSFEAALLYCEKHSDKKVGLTSGCFDLLHDFHVRYLIKCARKCDILIVGVDSDAMVREAKGPERPFQSEFQRLQNVNALKMVDIAYIQDSLEDFTNVAEHFLRRGGVVFRNQVFEGRENEIALGTVQGIAKVIIIPDIEEMSSTTALTKKIRTGLNGS